jgi:hypothetical protein
VRIVTVCEEGINRANTAKWMLQFRDNEVLVILLDGRYQAHPSLPSPPKLVVWDVGPDRFEHHFNRELVGMLRVHGSTYDWPKGVEGVVYSN